MPRVVWAGLGAVVAVAGCVPFPAGPSLLVLPGPGKSFEAFQADNGVCRQWATQQVPPEATADYWNGNWVAQRLYDFAYQQCMYAKGHQIPAVGAPGHSVPTSPPPLPPPGTGSEAP